MSIRRRGNGWSGFLNGAHEPVENNSKAAGHTEFSSHIDTDNIPLAVPSRLAEAHRAFGSSAIVVEPTTAAGVSGPSDYSAPGIRRQNERMVLLIAP
jgi:hypothetical protein